MSKRRNRRRRTGIVAAEQYSAQVKEHYEKLLAQSREEMAAVRKHSIETAKKLEVFEDAVAKDRPLHGNRYGECRLLRYCQRCVYHLKYVPELDETVKGGREGDAVESGRDICGNSFVRYINEVGEVRVRTHDQDHHCPECHTPLQVDGRVIYKKCAVHNKDFRCKDFRPKKIWLAPFELDALLIRARKLRARNR